MDPHSMMIETIYYNVNKYLLSKKKILNIFLTKIRIEIDYHKHDLKNKQFFKKNNFIDSN